MGTLEREEILEYIDHDRREVVYPHMRRDVAPDIVRLISHIEDEAKISFSRIAPANLEKRVEQEINYWRDSNRTLEWRVYEHDFPSNLLDVLKHAGFSIGSRGALMVFDLEERPERLLELPEHKIVRITDPQYLNEFQDVSEAVWNENLEELTEFIAMFLRRYPDYMNVYIVYNDKQPVSCARSMFHPKSRFSFLLGGSTHPDFRNRGFYSALLRARAQDALERGVRFLSVGAMPSSQKILAKYGFQVVSYLNSCEIDFTRDPSA